jgi:alkylation response protein AidB-like acyl-CoA dehydrogenase
VTDSDASLEPAQLAQLARLGELDLPAPGRGQTRARFESLLDWGRRDLTLARLVEAHADAVAICAEAGMQSPAGLLGVWASEGRASTLEARRSSGGWLLNGTRQYCSGSEWVSHALVTARIDEDAGLFVLPVGERGVSFDPSGWKAPAFSETRTAAMHVSNVALPADAMVGLPGFYLDRPGFWHGAAGVAACWAGGAVGLVEHLRHKLGDDPHAQAHLGAMEAAGWALRALVGAAADHIDANPTDRVGGEALALALRHVVEELCQDVLRRFGRAGGPGPLAFDSGCARRLAELVLYLRQSHAERDLQRLGALSQRTTP